MKEIEFVSSPSYGDPRFLLKRQTLMQDYQELRKEAEFKMRKLEMMKQKKLTLEAEVKFLRRRYKHLKQDQTLETSPEMLRLPESRGLEIPSGKRKKDPGLREPVPCFDLKQKKALANNGNCDLEKKLKRSRGNEVLTNSVVSLPDLNGDGKASVADKVPGFDLNQISREEEEPEVNGEHVEATENATLGNGNVDLHSEMKLPICRDVEKEMNNRAVKRKVSWQDPVALSV